MGAATGTLDAVDVQQVDRELVATRDGASEARVRLERSERVAWIQSRGVVGAALTDERVLGVSVQSAGWRSVRLVAGERLVRGPSLGGNIWVAATQRRILGFHAASGRWSEVRLAPGEVVLQLDAGDRVAAVVTNKRAVGFTPFAPPRAERLRVREGVESLRVLGSLVTVRTERRLLTFDASHGGWRGAERAPP